MPTYARLPVSFVKGRGAWLWDDEGKRYLDALSGIAVCGLGHSHPMVQEAVCRQAGQLIHTSNLYQIDLQEDVAERLCELSGLDNVFFSNSGAEANEAAIKIARSYGHQKGIDAPVVIVMEAAFHGRTIATLSATSNPSVRTGFGPLVPGFRRVAFNDCGAVESLRSDPNVVAVMVEPIQGEGGINVPSEDYLKRLRGICDDNDWLLMLDEIQTGMGRTGRWFAFEHAGIMPDVCTLAKALGNGVPVGACLARGDASRQLTAGRHGSTFGGNPFALSAALAVLITIEKDGLVENAAEMGAYIMGHMTEIAKTNRHIKEVRGEGLMIGIEMDEPCTDLVNQALEKQLLINVTAGNTIRLLPPLILDKTEADLLINTLNVLLN